MGSEEVRMETVLVVRRYAILEAFVARVREIGAVPSSVSAVDIARPAGAVVAYMSRSLAGMRTEPMESTRVAYDYTDARLAIRFEVHAILAELGLLRAVIADIAIKSGVADPREIERLSALFHRIITDAVLRATTASGGKRATS